MAYKTMEKPMAVVTFSMCIALLFGMSHAQVIPANAPSQDEFKIVNSNEIFLELAPGVIEEIVTKDVAIPDPVKCFASVGKVTTCILDILQNLGKGNLNFITPKCCEGFAEISSQCWTSVLPFDAFTTGIIKNICSRTDAAPPVKVM